MSKSSNNDTCPRPRQIYNVSGAPGHVPATSDANFVLDQNYGAGEAGEAGEGARRTDRFVCTRAAPYSASPRSTLFGKSPRMMMTV